MWPPSQVPIWRDLRLNHILAVLAAALSAWNHRQPAASFSSDESRLRLLNPGHVFASVNCRRTKKRLPLL